MLEGDPVSCLASVCESVCVCVCGWVGGVGGALSSPILEVPVLLCFPQLDSKIFYFYSSPSQRTVGLECGFYTPETHIHFSVTLLWGKIRKKLILPGFLRISSLPICSSLFASRSVIVFISHNATLIYVQTHVLRNFVSPPPPPPPPGHRYL